MDQSTHCVAAGHRVMLVSLVLSLCAFASSASAALVTPVDLGGLTLGAKIVGPVGPEVETTFANGAGDGIGDLISSVSCPAGFASCTPPTNPPGTIYTYQHQVTPGVDFPNDAPFPSPDTILPFDGADQFALAFAAVGFNGVAGYSFSDATAVLAAGATITIEQLADDSLVWRLSPGAGWDTGESITFFWQTTQPPSGPGGIYGLGSTQSGTANGPLPTPIIAQVALPASFGLMMLGMAGLAGQRRCAHRRSDL